jgi:hypothetical protein
MGLSIGWGDQYHRSLPGQYIDITGLPDGNYRLKVIVDYDGGFQETDDANNSSYVDFTLPLPSIPSAPSNLTAAAVSSNQINLAWSDNTGVEDSYELERSTSSSFTTGFKRFTLPAGNTSYVDTSVAAATTYYYRARARNETSGSNYSSTASVTTPAGPPAPGAPLAPSNLTATAAAPTQINLTWADNSSDETSVVLERSTSSTFGTITSVTLGANTTSHADTSLAAGTTYYYRVKATNANGSSPYSNTASATTPNVAGPPKAPTNMTATPTGSTKSLKINLKWTDNATNETSLIVERSTNQTDWTLIRTLPANTSSHGDTSSLQRRTTYYYRVSAINGLGSSPYSNTASATTP